MRRGRVVLVALISVATLATAFSAAAADWPMFQQNARHTGLSTETSLGAANTAGLVPQWIVNTGAQAFASPAVVHNATLDKTLVYVANQAGTMTAYDADTGARVWWFDIQGHIASSPAVVGNTIYFGANNHRLYALNATTGAEICNFEAAGVIASSPVVVNLDGSGPWVYFGDNGLSGADDGGNVWAIDGRTCAQKWVFDNFGEPPGSTPLAGVWSPIAFARDADGRPLLFFGGSSSDSGVYAVHARTGARVWRVQAEVFSEDDDVGAGATVAPVGMNGFADGVVYISGKNRIVYALNLRTGARIWRFSIRDDAPMVGGSTRSTAALVGTRLYVGYGGGVYALDARTGAKIWRADGTAEVISSPAVSGAKDNRVLFVGDLGGLVYGFDLQTGARLWSYRTGGFIYGSAAVSGGKVFIASSDGFLYAFGLGGGASAKPETTIVSPAGGSTVPNPNGDLAVSGNATDDLGVDKVLVAVKDTLSAKWWNASTGTWVGVFEQHEATLTSPGGTSTGWSTSFPVPFVGGSFAVQAEAVDAHGQHDVTPPISRFIVDSLGNPPDTTIDEPASKQVFHFEQNTDGSVRRESFEIAVRGTATDSGGTKVGVQRVVVVIKNWEHGEYWCGAAGCPSKPSQFWRPEWTAVNATLAAPGAASTGWTTSFFTYDHPHSYRIEAWAIDRDGEKDNTRPVVFPVCVRDPGNNFCGG
jgi:outer membrane protein assembly factor BamB